MANRNYTPLDNKTPKSDYAKKFNKLAKQYQGGKNGVHIPATDADRKPRYRK